MLQPGVYLHYWPRQNLSQWRISHLQVRLMPEILKLCAIICPNWHNWISVALLFLLIPDWVELELPLYLQSTLQMQFQYMHYILIGICLNQVWSPSYYPPLLTILVNLLLCTMRRWLQSLFLPQLPLLV
jgi:hypothetical protein